MPDTLEFNPAEASTEKASFSMSEIGAAERAQTAEAQSRDYLQADAQPTVGQVHQEIEAALKPSAPEVTVNPDRLRGLGNRLVFGYRAMHIAPENKG